LGTTGIERVHGRYSKQVVVESDYVKKVRNNKWRHDVYPNLHHWRKCNWWKSWIRNRSL